MYLKNAISILEEDVKFLEWKKEHKDAFLSYGFLMIDPNVSAEWQIGYYDKKIDKVATFILQNKKVVEVKVDAVFKEPGKEILPLDRKTLKLNIEEIIEKLDAFQEKEYPKEKTLKTMVIVQNLQEFGNVWNITHVTNSYKALNVKLKCEDGSILKHKLSSFMDFTEKPK